MNKPKRPHRWNIVQLANVPYEALDDALLHQYTRNVVSLARHHPAALR